MHVIIDGTTSTTGAQTIVGNGDAPLEFFPEGTRSRRGIELHPKCAACATTADMTCICAADMGC